MDFQSIKNFWQAVLDTLSVIPDGIIAVLTLAVSVLVGLALYRLMTWMIRSVLAARYRFARSLLVRMRGPLRLALVLLSLSIAARLAPFEPPLGATIAEVIQLAFILLVGWMALASTEIAAQLYLRRYDISTADNLLARKHLTQIRVLKGALNVMIITITLGAALMTFDAVRQFGVGLFTSAGIAGIIVGLAARPVLSNLLAGVQLAMTQPIRLDDVVVIENEWGRVEDITATYVVIKIWDWRRLIVPLSYFIEKPIQNWTRESAAVIGTVFLYVDYTVPIDAVRHEVNNIVKDSTLWDGQVANVQVTDTKERTVELRALVSAGDASKTWDLRCLVRERLIAYLQQNYPGALPRTRAELDVNSPPLAPSESRRHECEAPARQP